MKLEDARARSAQLVASSRKVLAVVLPIVIVIVIVLVAYLGWMILRR